MTTAITRDPRFGQITGFAGPNASPLVALCGRKVLIAEKSGDRVSLLGQSPDLGGTVLAADNSTVGELHILTSAGYVRTDDANTPAILATTSFTPGDGRWIFRSGNYVVTPLAFGGIQSLHKTTGVATTRVRTGLSSTRFGAGNSSLGYLWVVDETRAKIATYIVNAGGGIEYTGLVNAPNCRDVVKVVVDATQGNLFVVCKKRIVRFTIPTGAVSPELTVPVFAEDYGTRSLEYTDFVVVAPNSYWIGRRSEDDGYPLAYDLGPVYGVWDGSLGDNGELLVAAPKMSAWNVTNVVPTFDEDTGGGDGGLTPPEVIVPDPPVITSPDTAIVTEGELWEYTITATGTGPITYSIVAKPVWLSAADLVTGYFSGVQFTVGTYEITVSATNAGGTTTQVVTLTVVAALYEDLTGISTNGGVWNVVRVGQYLYFGGDFTTVTDRDGTYSRTRLACLDTSTGLWTAWTAPAPNSSIRRMAQIGNYLYVAAVSANATYGGTTRNAIAKIDLTTGALEAFNPTFNSQPQALTAYNGSLYASGAFTTVDSQTRRGVCCFNADALTAFRVQASDTRELEAWNSTAAPSVEYIGYAGGKICYAGSFRLPRTAGGFWQFGYGECDPTSGSPVQMSEIGNGLSGASAVASGPDRDGVLRWAQQTATTQSARTGPSGTPSLWSSGSFCAMSGAGKLDAVSETAKPTFTPTTPNLAGFSKVDSDNYFITGTFTALGGDTEYQSFGLITSGGVAVGGFTARSRKNAGFQSSPGTVNHSRMETFGTLQVAIVMGTYGNIGSFTYDGAPVANLMFLNPETGARL